MNTNKCRLGVGILYDSVLLFALFVEGTRVYLHRIAPRYKSYFYDYIVYCNNPMDYTCIFDCH